MTLTSNRGKDPIAVHGMHPHGGFKKRKKPRKKRPAILFDKKEKFVKKCLKNIFNFCFFLFIPKRKYLQTERIQLDTTKKKYRKYLKPFMTLCYASAKLYNVANYEIRQRLFKNKNHDGSFNEKCLLKYGALYHLLKDKKWYKALPAQTAQQGLRTLISTWKGYFEALKDYMENPEKYGDEPRIPKFKKGWDVVWLATFTNQQCKILEREVWKDFKYPRKECFVKFPKKKGMPALPPVKTRLKGKINQVRILPRGKIFIVEIVYEKEPQKLKLDRKRHLAIDLGVNNLITTANNVGLRSLVIKGGVVKSINQFWNKKDAEYRSIKDLQGIKGETKRLKRLRMNRNNQIENIFHQVSRRVVEYCILAGIGSVTIGYNKQWKTEVNMGKQNNQNFVSIPHRKLVDMIAYKAGLVGIKVKTVKESYTSKVSALDLEPVKKHSKYVGRRKCRGLFKSKKGTIINADVNGALNILRLALGDGFIKDKKDLNSWLHPLALKITPRLQNILQKRTSSKSKGSGSLAARSRANRTSFIKKS